MSSMRKVRVLMWSLTSFISVMTSTTYIYYFVFLIQLVLLIKDSKGILFDFLYLLLYSCLLPDNYSVIVFAMISSLIMLQKVKKSGYMRMLWITAGFLLSTIVNDAPMVNVGMAALYLISSTIFLISCVSVWNEDCTKVIMPIVDEIFIILACATISNLIGKILGIQRAIPGDDWSTGTLGDGQGNPLFMMIAIIFFSKTESMIRNPCQKLWFIITSMFMLFSSHSYALLLAFIISLGLGVIKEYGLKRVFYFAGPVIIAFIVYIHMRNFDTMIIKALTNQSYLFNLFPKLRVIIVAFVEIPKSSFFHFLLGVGPGGFSSRAAATCTGLYVRAYSRFFQPSMGEWMKDYVYERIYQGFIDSGGPSGSILRLPYSSIATMMGEYGLLGVASCVLVIKKFLKNKTTCIMIVFFIISCFLDNWLEYMKVIVMLSVCLCISYRKQNRTMSRQK